MSSSTPSGKLSKEVRQQRVLAELKVDATLRVSDLAGRFEVTTETIRRDLDALASRGLINRTYGGAAPTGLAAEPDFNERYRQHVEERRRVAQAAVMHVENGDVLMIDAGSTTTHFARRLAADVQDFTAITNSVGVASSLASNSTIRVMLCPGDYNPHEGGVCGPETLAFLRRFHANKAFIGASALDEEGPSDASPEAAWVKRAMLERSDRHLLLVDAAKFNLRALDRICDLNALDDVVADAAPPRRLARELTRAGIELRLA